jgi:hypothetical protein
VALSRPKQGFDSPWERQENNALADPHCARRIYVEYTLANDSERSEQFFVCDRDAPLKDFVSIPPPMRTVIPLSD